jgi:hypothetical protein
VPRATIAEALLVDRITPETRANFLAWKRSLASVAWGRQLTVVSVYALAGSMGFRGYVLVIDRRQGLKG